MNNPLPVILKPGREKSVSNRHPWIFSGAVASFPPFSNGDVLAVHSSEGRFLAKASFHTANSISGRVLTFREEPIEDAVRARLDEALLFRQRLFTKTLTNCYRLVNAEGDGLSGLIIDLYDDVAVMQISTCGMEALRPFLISYLKEKLSLKALYEKSCSSAREQEGLAPRTEWVFGQSAAKVIVQENGIYFAVNIARGQKTGLFLDQRQMRQQVEQLAQGKKVLNCFAYSGGFSLFALKGGADHVTSVDVSGLACNEARENSHLNHFPETLHDIVCADVFDYLRSQDKLEADFVILDPPAFAKKRGDIPAACRGYQEINRQVIEKLPPHSYLLTCSCSHFIDQALFGQVLFQAALGAGREVRVCGHHLQAPDHPVSLFHPEGSYLKSLLLYVV